MKRIQSAQDKILWRLADNGSKLTRKVLMRREGIKYADLDPILDELASWRGKEDRTRQMITLI
ncbi:MAG: hypothetical protein LUQ38_06565 [Methanotrichaceae archaeon]|nr:hypothetical protein [Methanotrichaceae archaeon]